MARNGKYDVYTNFNGADVRKTFFSHLRKQLMSNGTTVFNDENLERGASIGAATLQAIRGSRIAIVVLTERYALSSWCLDELVEILKCRNELGQTVMPVFYEVDPSDVRKQIGEFGSAFDRNCKRQEPEKRLRWSQALSEVGSIFGEVSRNWDNEAKMIEEIAKHVSYRQYDTPSGDFDDMVGLYAHLINWNSLLDLGNDEVKMLAIYGPAGIGKSTIARALHNRISSQFQHSCFMENTKGSYNRDFDDYSLKLYLQGKLLSNIFKQNGTRIHHLGAMRERLCDRKVLIVLDDVDDLIQLEALANETNWFGPGSRIIVTTQDRELLERHGININNIYKVDFPTKEEALEIFCRYAFKQSSPPIGFTEIAESVVDLCGNLPSSLRVVGSSVFGKRQEVWEEVIDRLVTVLDRRDIDRWCNKQRKKGKSWYSTRMTFLLIINLLLEIVSVAAEQLSSIHKPYFARISLVMSLLSISISIFDLTCKIRTHKARFECKWPIPWFYYPSPDHNRLFGRSTDVVLFFCALGQLAVSTTNCIFNERKEEGPIKVSVWPLFFAVGMVCSNLMEKPTISKRVVEGEITIITQ